MTRDDFHRALAGSLPPRHSASGSGTTEGGTGTWYDLGHLGVLGMRGRDAAKFLQGYLTCDLNSLAPTRWLLGALCNLQGRMVGNFTVSGDAEGVLLRMPVGVLPAVRQLLAKYAVFAKAKLVDETDDWVGLGLTGDAALAALTASGVDAGSAAGAEMRAGARVVLPDGELMCRGGDRWELWLHPAAALAAWQAMGLALPAHDIAEWHGADIAAGLPWVQATTSGEYLPQLFNLDRTEGLNFSKGCYLGQEIVTRLQHRGEAKRRTARFVVPAGSIEGDEVLDGTGRKVGELVLVGRSPKGDTEALAVLERGAIDRSALDRGDHEDNPDDNPAQQYALTTSRGAVAVRKLPYALTDKA